MQHDYVHIRLIYVRMQHSYVHMQIIMTACYIVILTCDLNYVAHFIFNDCLSCRSGFCNIDTGKKNVLYFEKHSAHSTKTKQIAS